MKCRLSINRSKFEISSIKELETAWEQTADKQFREIWMEAQNGPKLCVLCSGNIGWLMYLPKDSEIGWSSWNSAYRGNINEMVQYRLVNGQVDEYSAEWALPENDLILAVGYFVEFGDRSPLIQWRRDD